MPIPKDKDQKDVVIEEDELLEVLEAEQPALVAGSSTLSAQSGKSSKTEKSERYVEKIEDTKDQVATTQYATKTELEV